jgi:hypothetical protein
LSPGLFWFSGRSPRAIRWPADAPGSDFIGIRSIISGCRAWFRLGLGFWFLVGFSFYNSNDLYIDDLDGGLIVFNEFGYHWLFILSFSFGFSRLGILIDDHFWRSWWGCLRFIRRIFQPLFTIKIVPTTGLRTIFRWFGPWPGTRL